MQSTKIFSAELLNSQLCKKIALKFLGHEVFHHSVLVFVFHHSIFVFHHSVLVFVFHHSIFVFHHSVLVFVFHHSIFVFHHSFVFYLFCYSSAWNEEAPFSVPPHLRDQHSTFEGLQDAVGGANLSGDNTSVGGVAISSAEADNLLS